VPEYETHRGMRPGMMACICVFFLAVAAVHAQEDSDIAKKLQTRNVDVAKVLFQNKAFLQASPYYGDRAAYVNNFYFIDRVRTKDFMARAFYGADPYWAGNFQYSTANARTTGRNVIVNATTAVDTKTSETKEARESGKVSSTRDYPFNRDFRGRGRSQDRFDKEGEKALYGAVPLGLGGDLHPLTIDEVRALLNKNK